MSSKESIGNWNRKGLEIEHVSLHSHEFYVINLVLCIVDKSLSMILVTSKSFFSYL